MTDFQISVFRTLKNHKLSTEHNTTVIWAHTNHTKTQRAPQKTVDASNARDLMSES